MRRLRDRAWRRVAGWLCPARAVRLRGWPPGDIYRVYAAGVSYFEEYGRLLVTSCSWWDGVGNRGHVARPPFTLEEVVCR